MGEVSGSRGQFEWHFNDRGVVVIDTTLTGPPRCFIPFDVFSQINREGVEFIRDKHGVMPPSGFPQETADKNQRSTQQIVQDGLLLERHTLDQNLARFRDKIKAILKRTVEDPDMLNLMAQVLARANEL